MNWLLKSVGRPGVKYAGFRSLAAGLVFFLLSITPALADMSSPFADVGDSDWAIAWINHMFRGDALPDGLTLNIAAFDTMTQGLRQALGLYSSGMLILAGFILFYHLVSILAETAHSGLAFGRRMNPVWAPIRLVVALALLVPISGGLSSGQYLVIKIAEEGSRLASNAWRTVLQVADTNLSGLVMPHAPDVGGLVASATEMEMCHLIYEQLYGPVQNDKILQNAGAINDVTKISADRLSDETWRYSNTLNADSPLCGEYRFAGYRVHEGTTEVFADDTARIAAELESFSRMKTSTLIVDSHGLALRFAPGVMNGTWPTDTEMRNDLDVSASNLRAALYGRLHATLGLGPRLMEPALARASSGGWIAAGLFIPELVRLQESYGELIDHALPVAEEPAFAHPAIAQQALSDALRIQLGLQSSDNTEIERLTMFYGHVSHLVSSFHSWLTSSQMIQGEIIAPSSFDLHDRLTIAASPESVFALLAHAVDTAALLRGVWGVDPGSNDAGYPFVSHSGTTGYNPFAMLAEFGRRQYQLGLYMIGLAGQSLTTPSAMAPAVFAGIGGVCFTLGAWTIIFALPFLVFFRFLMAILTWMLTLFEAVAAMPLVALAHLTPTGEGLSGGTARQAYLLWLGLLLRPLLTLMGLVAGLVFFAFGVSLLSAVLSPFARISVATNSGLLITVNVAVVLLFDIMMFALVNASFKGIYLLPDQALRWISNFVVAESSETSATTSSPSGQPGQGGGSSGALIPAMTRMLSYVHQQLGPNNSVTSTRLTLEQKAAADIKSQALKKALFPSYNQKDSNPSAEAEANKLLISQASASASATATSQVTSSSSKSQTVTGPDQVKSDKTNRAFITEDYQKKD